jgi:hypothetical protein
VVEVVREDTMDRKVLEVLKQLRRMREEIEAMECPFEHLLTPNEPPPFGGAGALRPRVGNEKHEHDFDFLQRRARRAE